MRLNNNYNSSLLAENVPQPAQQAFEVKLISQQVEAVS